LAEAGRRWAAAGDTTRTADYLAQVGEAMQQALKEMRLLVYELRPPVLEREGLVGALQRRLDAVEGRAGVETRLLIKGSPELPVSVEEGLYRIAQEALNNALKHAAATLVTVRLKASAEAVDLEIMDNGVGFDSNALRDRAGMGLANMQERAERLGGSFALYTAPDRGTTIKIHLTLAENLADTRRVFVQREKIPEIAL
jgi:signal transduction histidine kinase